MADIIDTVVKLPEPFTVAVARVVLSVPGIGAVIGEEDKKSKKIKKKSWTPINYWGHNT
jgi:hypothetical protein